MSMSRLGLLVVVPLLLLGCDDKKADTKAAPSAAAASSAKPKAAASGKAAASAKPAGSAKAGGGEGTKLADIKPEQLKKIVDELNEGCADSHCEGDFNWKFKSLECKDGKCTLSFNATNKESKKAKDDKLTFEYKGLVLDGKGTQNEQWTEALNDAILEWEVNQDG